MGKDKEKEKISYKVIHNVSSDVFSEEVERYLNDGYKLVGNPFTKPNQYCTGTFFCQAVYKKFKEDPKQKVYATWHCPNCLRIIYNATEEMIKEHNDKYHN